MKKVKEYRLNHGWSQEKLAEEVELSVGYISAIENGKKRPSLKRLEKIAAVLGVPVGALVNEQETPSCPFLASLKNIQQIDSLDDMTGEILEILLSLPIEERAKILGYISDLKKLSEFKKNGKN